MVFVNNANCVWIILFFIPNLQSCNLSIVIPFFRFSFTILYYYSFIIHCGKIFVNNFQKNYLFQFFNVYNVCCLIIVLVGIFVYVDQETYSLFQTVGSWPPSFWNLLMSSKIYISCKSSLFLFPYISKSSLCCHHFGSLHKYYCLKYLFDISMKPFWLRLDIVLDLSI